MIKRELVFVEEILLNRGEIRISFRRAMIREIGHSVKDEAVEGEGDFAALVGVTIHFCAYT